MNEFELTKAWLKDTYNIRVSADWLTACLEWIRQENQGQLQTANDVMAQVYEQWLMSDLAEIGEPVLPQNLSAVEKLELTSNYPLQMISLVDVGFPLYGQKQKLQGSENPNEQVSADKPLQPAWEPKPSRMLLLQLTDGHTQVQAMEYHPIKDLHIHLPSGIKLLLSGNLLCRRGMILLTPECVQILGGEVDLLSEQNSPLAIIEQTMERNRQDEGKHTKMEFPGKFVTQGVDKMNNKPMLLTKNEGIYNSQRNPGYSSEYQSYNGKREVLSDMKQETELTTASLARSHNKLQIKQEIQINDNDVHITSSNVKRESMFNGRTKDNIHTLMKKVANPVNFVTNTNSNADEHNWPDFDETDADLFTDDFQMADIADPTLLPNLTTSRNQKSSENSDSLLSSLLPANTLNAFSYSSDQAPSDSLNASVQEKIFVKASNSLLENIKTSSPNIQSQSMQTSKLLLSAGPAGIQSSYDVSQMPQNKAPLFKAKAVGLGSKHNTSDTQLKQCKLSDMFHANTNSNKEKLLLSNKGSDSGCHPSSTPQNDLCGSVDSTTLQSTPDLKHTCISGINMCLTSKPKGTATGILHTDKCVPYGYLSNLARLKPPGSLIVKAYISTLTDKLNSCAGSKWSLSCRINDGTACVEVDLADNVLTELIGFSALDSVLMRQKIKTDPQIKYVLKEGLSQCQHKLINTSCLMEVRVISTEERAVVTKLVPVSKQHVESLLKRVETQICA